MSNTFVAVFVHLC